MRPLARRRRASFLPRPSLFSACSVASIGDLPSTPQLPNFQLPTNSQETTSKSQLFPWESCGVGRCGVVELSRFSLYEQRRDRRLFVNAPNGLTQQARDRELLDLAAALCPLGRQRDRIGDDHLVDRRRLEALDRLARQHA